MEISDFERFVEKHKWQFAKSMPQTPHEYTVREWAIDDDVFDNAVAFIRENGVDEDFYGKRYSYVHIGDWKYWTMGNPIIDTRIINRAKA